MNAMCGKLRFELNAKKRKISECLGWEGVYRGMWWRDAPEVTARMAPSWPDDITSRRLQLRSTTPLVCHWRLHSVTDENLRTCSSSTLNSSSMYTSKTNPRVYGMKAYSISLWAYLLSEYQLLHISIPGIEAISKSLHLAYYSFFVTHFLMPNLIKVVITDRFTRI